MAYALSTIAGVTGTRHACIIGCGTAGQASAILLARGGWRVTVLERAATLSPVGAGLLLQPTGIGVLQQLGVLDRVLALGARVDRLVGFTTGGKHLLNLAYADLRPDLFGLGVHRGMLFETLQREIVASGAAVKTGVEVTGVEPGWDDAGLTPRVVVDGHGNRHGPFDLVIIADGARSHLRAGCPHVTRERAYPWGAMWFVAEDLEGRFARVLSQAYESTTGMVGFLPSGRRDEHAPQTVSMFYSVRMRDVDAIRAEGLESLRERIARLTPTAARVLEQIRTMDQVITASYMDVRVRRSHVGNVVVIGDAAHATSPQLGQGANLALLDASSLTACIGSHATMGGALAAFDTERRGSVLFYQRASRWLTPVFQSDSTWLAPWRDACMALVLGVPPLRRQALLSLAGVKTGVLTAGGVPRVWHASSSAASEEPHSQTFVVRE